MQCNHGCGVVATTALSLLICTLRSDFEGGRKVVLQTWIFFLVGDPEKKLGLYYKPTAFQVGHPEKNMSLQNHISVTLKISSKGARLKGRPIKIEIKNAHNCIKSKSFYQTKNLFDILTAGKQPGILLTKLCFKISTVWSFSICQQIALLLFQLYKGFANSDTLN